MQESTRIRVSLDIPISVHLNRHDELLDVLLGHIQGVNSPEFGEKRIVVGIHEGTHIEYCRDVGHEPKLYGPKVRYDPFTEKFDTVYGSVELPPYETRMTAPPLAVAKFFIGPVYTEQQLLNHRTEKEIWHMARFDLKNLNEWVCERSREVGDARGLTLDKIRESVHEDCENPKFRKRIWNAAREFEVRVFGQASRPWPSEQVTKTGYRNLGQIDSS